MQTKENKMGVMPIDKLLISMSLPMMISMLVQALYFWKTIEIINFSPAPDGSGG